MLMPTRRSKRRATTLHRHALVVCTLGAAQAAFACSASPTDSTSALEHPQFPGSGTDGAGDPIPGAEITCYFGLDLAQPAATIEHVVEILQGQEVVRVRLTLDPRFADNTYGAHAIGWDATGKGHKFKDLIGSDHALFLLTDAGGEVISDFKLDYISADTSTPSGYGTLGVLGGDGKMLSGDEAAIVSASTSMALNLNDRGLASYTTDSPLTDELYTPDPAAPAWDYRVVYEFHVTTAAFGAAGFGAATIESIHASPSKTGTNTVVVDPHPCPPDWGGYCNDPDGCEPGDGTPPPCNDPDGCDPGDGTPPPPPPCNDPDGCDPGTSPPDDCRIDADCPSGEFCEGGSCEPIIG